MNMSIKNNMLHDPLSIKFKQGSTHAFPVFFSSNFEHSHVIFVICFQNVNKP